MPNDPDLYAEPDPPIPGPGRRWEVTPHTLELVRPLEPGEELTIANASDRKAAVCVAAGDGTLVDVMMAMVGQNVELRSEVERIGAEALRYYHADGSFETLGSPEEVVRRRVEAAAEIARLKAERDARLDPSRVVAFATEGGRLCLFTDADAFRAWIDEHMKSFGRIAWTVDGCEWVRAADPAPAEDTKGDADG